MLGPESDDRASQNRQIGPNEPLLRGAVRCYLGGMLEIIVFGVGAWVAWCLFWVIWVGRQVGRQIELEETERRGASNWPLA